MLNRLLMAHASVAILAFSPVLAAENGLQNSNSPTLFHVLLDNGQSLTAAVDIRSDDEYLWLRFERETVALYRPIRWQRVEKVWNSKDRFTAEQFHDVVQQFSSRRPQQDLTNHNGLEQDVRRDKPTELLGRVEPPRAAALIVDAFVTNWDADVEVDGVVLCITVTDRFGQIVPAGGTLNAELIADRRSRQQPQLARDRQAFERLGQWTKTLHFEDGGQTCFRLPFQAVHPEFDAQVASVGMVNVKLAVAGSGVLQASVADVRIRPTSQIRDQFQRALGSRFFHTEGTGHGRAFLMR